MIAAYDGNHIKDTKVPQCKVEHVNIKDIFTIPHIALCSELLITVP
jgi:hypothetical protein